MHRYVDGNTYKWTEYDVSFPLSSLIQIELPEQKNLPAFDILWYDGGMKPFIPEELKEDKESPGSFKYAETVTEAINLAAVALRAGKMVEYDSKSMKITNDEAANKYLTREYRKGWEI